MRKPFIIGSIALLLVLLVVPSAATQGNPLSGYSICLDPGHGGYDPGAVYDDGTIYLEEADINLDVAYGLKALLEADGAAVAMTRTDDTYHNNDDRYTFCNAQGATILVSLHTNSVTSPTGTARWPSTSTPTRTTRFWPRPSTMSCTPT